MPFQGTSARSARRMASEKENASTAMTPMHTAIRMIRESRKCRITMPGMTVASMNGTDPADPAVLAVGRP